MTPVRETAPVFDSGVELPAGQGREILIASCLSCHELTTLPLFAAFYTRDSWRTLVLTMKEHGAEINGAQIEVLADYLAQHFGPGPSAEQEAL
jgi:mono/diheme cytochrome c family protein